MRPSGVSMPPDSTAHRVARLRAEIERIRAENRRYFSTRPRSEKEKLDHQKRRDRIDEIRAELASLLKQLPRP